MREIQAVRVAYVLRGEEHHEIVFTDEREHEQPAERQAARPAKIAGAADAPGFSVRNPSTN